MAIDSIRDPDITNTRAEREWLWLCERVGEARARAAIGRIPGNRRAFPLNIARALGVALPEESLLPLLPDSQRQRSEIARSALSEIRQCLR